MANGRNPGSRRGTTSSNTGGNSFRIDFDFSQIEEEFDSMTVAAGKAARVAAQAGAEELYIEAKLRCPVSQDAHYFYGKNSKKTGVRYLFKPGNLRDAIYQVYSKDNSKEGVMATYHVAWNHRKAPYGFMVEFGTSNAPAHPFLRPAFDAKYKDALNVARATYIEEMKIAVKSLT